MTEKIKKLLAGKGENYIMPFFWQHGEDEATLRQYMKVIHESSIGAVCIESRPHPDFCGPKWWADMDVIIDEAKKWDMKVWILDDSHFPTGYANGALKDQPDDRCRQGICLRTYDCGERQVLEISEEELFHPAPWEPTQIEMYMGDGEVRQFNDDRLLGIYAVCKGRDNSGLSDPALRVDLKLYIKDNQIQWEVPEGDWKVYVIYSSRNVGYHRNYINMMDQASCKVLLDAVYEPHYARYKDEFGETIAGFFSDEPELGNGHLYENEIICGNCVDLPWSAELEERIETAFGDDFAAKLILLWEQEADSEDKAKVRYTYMDAVTRLVEADFSRQIGDWCRERNVQYIGHVIEDNNQHARTGSSLGHYYRGLSGQDMAGIDNIGGQVLPQQEDVDNLDVMFGRRHGEFFHYMLGKLGSSAAAIEPLKKGRSMCEIFGAYGWSCGVRMEKYLIDHFLVRGINHYVPHAFSPKEFPDPDCPPHFYAHGHNPQYRHFGALMAYTNRVCELISGGRHIAPVAILYHAEGEWTGEAMYSHRPARPLADAQIEYDYIHQDVFAQRGDFNTEIKPGVLKVNTQEYKVVLIPAMQYITKALAEAIAEMKSAGITVLFVEKIPVGICDISIMPADNRVCYFHYEHEDSAAIYMIVNEGTESYRGTVAFKEERTCYLYDAWDNTIHPAPYQNERLSVVVEPLKSLLVIFDRELPERLSPDLPSEGEKISFTSPWQRSICKSIEYPEFSETKEIAWPDNLAGEEPEFSGFVRYESTFNATKEDAAILTVSDAHEGMEVFVNGKSQGIQIAPPFVYDISSDVKTGENTVVIEVATTLEREMAKIPDLMTGQLVEPKSSSGITGEVFLYRQSKE